MRGISVERPFTELPWARCNGGRAYPSARSEAAMDFPIAELMDEEACYAKLLALAPPRRPGLPAVRGARRPGRPSPPPRPGPRLPLQGLPPGLQRLHRHGPAGTQRRPVVELVLILRGFAQGVPTAQLARELGCDRTELLELRHRLQHAGLAVPGPVAAWTTRWSRPTRCTRTRGKKGVPHTDPRRPAAAAGEQGPRPRHLGQRPAAGLRGGGREQRPAPAVGRAARRRRDAGPGGA